MEKLYMIVIEKKENEMLNKIFEELGDAIKDVDATKIFNVMGFELILYGIVCTEETFININEQINGQRLF